MLFVIDLLNDNARIRINYGLLDYAIIAIIDVCLDLLAMHVVEHLLELCAVFVIQRLAYEHVARAVKDRGASDDAVCV